MLWEVLALAGAAMAVFERAGLETALADDDAMRDAEQFRIGEFDAGARIAIIVEHLDTGCSELGVQGIGRGCARAADFSRLSGTSTT